MLSEVTRESEKRPGPCFRSRGSVAQKGNSPPEQIQVYNDTKVTYLKIDMNLMQ